MELIILGSGTGVPNLKRNPSGIYLRCAGRNLLFDCGIGIVRKMLEAGITYHDPDYILFTHFHPDHIHDLTTLLFAAKNPASLRTKELLIIGPVGLKAYYRRIIKIYGRAIQPENYKLNFKEIRPPHGLDLNFCKISTCKTRHTPESLAYRLDDPQGRSLVYTGDSEFFAQLAVFAKNADILITECSFPDGLKVFGHLTPRDAARLAQKSNCRKLLLTHLYPVCAQYDIAGEAAKGFLGEVVIAEDLMSFSL